MLSPCLDRVQAHRAEASLTSAGSLLSPLCPPRPRSCHPLAALSCLASCSTQVGKHECPLCSAAHLVLERVAELRAHSNTACSFRERNLQLGWAGSQDPGTAWFVSKARTPSTQSASSTQGAKGVHLCARVCIRVCMCARTCVCTLLSWNYPPHLQRADLHGEWHFLFNSAEPTIQSNLVCSLAVKYLKFQHRVQALELS